MSKILLLLLFIPFFYSCNFGSEDELDVDVSGVDLEPVKIHRYGMELFSLNPESLKKELVELKDEFWFFLDADLEDTLNLIQIRTYITDPALIKLAEDAFEEYPDLAELENKLFNALKHYKYYFPEVRAPLVYSYISGIDFEFPVRKVDTVVIIGLDNYLGSNYVEYRKLGLPKYRRHEMQRQYVVRDLMKIYAREKIDRQKMGNKLLDEMIAAGKEWYFIEAMIPSNHDTIVCGYTNQQLNWAFENEWNVWAFLIENNLLYSSEFSDIQKFISEGPFTVFFGEESPARLGAFIGWQIIRKYMAEQQEVTLPQLMNNYDAQEILSKSGYKPSR